MPTPATSQSINSLRRRGVEVPDSITTDDVKAIRDRVKSIYLYGLNVWYDEVGRSLYASGLEWKDAETMALRISAAPGLGVRIAATEAERDRVAGERYSAAGDDSGNWFEYRPPLVRMRIIKRSWTR